MDTQVLILAVFGLFTTMVSAVGGPWILDRIRRQLTRQLRIQTARERPYVDFATAVERTLLDLHMMANDVAVDPDEYRAHFRAMEESRSALDLVGTQSIRVWAFRCRIAATSLSKNFQCPDKQRHYRTKLHIAKSEYV